MRLAMLRRVILNAPRRVCPQQCVNPRKSNVSGLPPRLSWFRNANRPNDLWIQQWRKKYAQGDVIVVRYADDFVMGFEFREDAERCLRELRGRMEKFGLTLHPKKTRLIANT
jgi:hypothetical protein